MTKRRSLHLLGAKGSNFSFLVPGRGIQIRRDSAEHTQPPTNFDCRVSGLARLSKAESPGPPIHGFAMG